MKKETYKIIIFYLNFKSIDMSLYEVEVNRLTKEIGKLKTEVEYLQDERDQQEDEQVELRFIIIKV